MIFVRGERRNLKNGGQTQGVEVSVEWANRAWKNPGAKIRVEVQAKIRTRAYVTRDVAELWGKK